MGILRTDRGARRAAELAFVREVAGKHGLEIVPPVHVAELRNSLGAALGLVDVLSAAASPEVAQQARSFVSQLRDRFQLP